MGEGYSNFFRIRRLGPSIYRSPPKNIKNFKHPQKIFEILATKKISQFCTLTLKKTLNCIEITLKLAQFCDDQKKYPQNLHTPQKIFIFLKTPKNIEIQNFEPPKNRPSLHMCENIRVHPPPPPGCAHLTRKHSACTVGVDFRTSTPLFDECA